MAKKKWYEKRSVRLLAVGAGIGVAAGIIYLYQKGKAASSFHGVRYIGQPLPYSPLRLGPEELTESRRSLEWGLALPRGNDPSSCAAMGSGPAAQACFELQRSREHLKHYMEGRGGRASLDASNQAMENAYRSYASMYRQPPVGVRTANKGSLGLGIYGG